MLSWEGPCGQEDCGNSFLSPIPDPGLRFAHLSRNVNQDHLRGRSKRAPLTGGHRGDSFYLQGRSFLCLDNMPSELSSDVEAEILEECQEAISYRFRQPDLLRASLTHASSANTRLASNERMEFLGDAIMGLVVVEQLYLRFPDYQEGDLTKIKSVVVSRRTCARMSKHLKLGEFIFLGRGMHQNGVVPMNILADVFESLVAAI